MSEWQRCQLPRHTERDVVIVPKLFVYTTLWACKCFLVEVCKPPVKRTVTDLFQAALIKNNLSRFRQHPVATINQLIFVPQITSPIYS